MTYSRIAKRAQRKARGKRAHEKVMDAIYAAQPEPQEDPRIVVIKARASLMHKTANDDMLMDLYCESAGQAISIGARNSDEAQAMWSLFKRFDRADDMYFRRIIGRSRFANVAKLEMLPERMETRADDRPDDRSEDEKHRDTVNGWMRWQGLLGHLTGHERHAIIAASRQSSGELHKGGALTTAGMSFVAAMRVLRGVEERG